MAAKKRVSARGGSAVSDTIDWGPLYDRADALYALAPWTWMLEDQLFAVQDPDTGVLGICSVMGTLGEHLAIAVYLGAEGLAGYQALRAEQDPEDMAEAFVRQNALQLSYESADLLDPRDRRVVKALGRKYRGANAWPRFRSQRPGYLPWHLTPDEARLFLGVLDQVIQVVPRVCDEPTMLDTIRPSHLMCRVRRDGVWGDEQVAIPAGGETVPVAATPSLTAAALADLQTKSTGPRRGVWEIDYAPMDGGIMDKGDDRPILGFLALIVEAQSGFILGTEILKSGDLAGQFFSFVLGALQKIPFVPARLQVSREIVRKRLAPLASALRTPVELCVALPALDQVKDSFLATL